MFTDSAPGAIQQLLEHPRVDASLEPSSADAASALQNPTIEDEE